jgi:hypothetical protein
MIIWHILTSVLILFLYLVINPRVRLNKTIIDRLAKKIPVLYEILKHSLECFYRTHINLASISQVHIRRSSLIIILFNTTRPPILTFLKLFLALNVNYSWKKDEIHLQVPNTKADRQRDYRKKTNWKNVVSTKCYGTSCPLLILSTELYQRALLITFDLRAVARIRRKCKSSAATRFYLRYAQLTADPSGRAV